MFVSFKEYLSQRLSKDSPQSTTDIKSDGLTVTFAGEESKNKTPPKAVKMTGINPEKMYGRRKKNELP